VEYIPNYLTIKTLEYMCGILLKMYPVFKLLILLCYDAYRDLG